MDTANTKVRLNKKKCQSGLDGMNLAYKITLDGTDNLYLPVKEVKNEADNTIVKIACVLQRKCWNRLLHFPNSV